MVFQATVTFLGLTGSAAIEAVLCALVVMWWALSTRRARPAPAKKMKLNPVDDDVPTPLPEAQGHTVAGPTDLDLGIDPEAFRAQVGRRCDLELDAFCDKVLQDLEDELGSTLRRDMGFHFEPFPAQVGRQSDLELDALCDKVPQDIEDELAGAEKHVEARPANMDLGIDFEAFQAQIRHDFETFQAQIGRRCDLTFQGSRVDFEAFQAQIGRQCDLELNALCESAIHDQSAKVMQDLEDEFGGGPVDAQATRQPSSAEPGMDFEVHSDRAFEGVTSHANDGIDEALDGMCAAMLRALENKCRGSGGLDDDAQGDYA